MKIIKVKNCMACPHNRFFVYMLRCELTGMIADKCEFPDSCPLPDEKEKEDVGSNQR